MADRWVRVSELVEALRAEAEKWSGRKHHPMARHFEVVADHLASSDIGSEPVASFEIEDGKPWTDDCDDVPPGTYEVYGPTESEGDDG